MRHHIDRVNRFSRLDPFEAFHHRVGNAVRALRPGIDDLVVFFALGDEAVLVLLLVLLDLILSFVDQLFLFGRYQQIVLAKRNSGPTGVRETETHHPVGKDHRILLTAMAIN